MGLLIPNKEVDKKVRPAWGGGGARAACPCDPYGDPGRCQQGLTVGGRAPVCIRSPCRAPWRWRERDL